MNKSAHVYLFVISLFGVLSCTVQDSPLQPCGAITYSSGFDGISRISFPSGDTETIFTSPERLWVDSIATDYRGGLIFASGWPGRSPYLIRHLRAGEAKASVIQPGFSASYLPTNQSIYYYYHSEGLLDESEFFMAPLDGSALPLKLDTSPGSFVYPNGIPMSLLRAPIVDSHDNVLFLGSDRKLKMLNSSGDGIKDLGVEKCLPLASIPESSTVICYDWTAVSTYSLNLSSRERTDFYAPFSRALYLPKLDALI